jgi:hypothetical protein
VGHSLLGVEYQRGRRGVVVVHAFGLNGAGVTVTSPTTMGVGVDEATAVDFPSLIGVPLDRTREAGGVWRRSTS